MAGPHWHRKDNDYHQNPKVVGLVHDVPRAVLLHGELCAYCARHLTDGFVPDRAVPLCGHAVGTARSHRVWELVHLLADMKLVFEVPGGLRVHDFLIMNPQLKRSVVEAERERWRLAKAKSRGESPGGTTLSNDNDVPAPTQQNIDMYLHPETGVTGVAVHRCNGDG